MPRVQAFLLCRQAEKIDGHFRNLFGIFDQAAVKGLPAAGGEFVLFYRLVQLNDEAIDSMRIVFTTPSGITQPLPPVPVDHPEQRILQGVVRINGLRFHEAGEHTFSLRYEGREIGSCGVLVTLPQERLK